MNFTYTSSQQDYYPFGWKLSGRQTTGSEDYRYGYQGQFAEEDKETGWNQFEARMYDGRIDRWMSTDPYGQYHSPYLGMGNRPTIAIDPDGRDVIFLSTKNAAWRFGHNAVIIGNNTDGGYYYSVNGTENRSPWGDNDKGVLHDLGTAEELVAQARNSKDIASKYTWDSYIHFTTSPEGDTCLKKVALEYVNAKHYDICNDSCLDIAQGVAIDFLGYRAENESSYAYGKGYYKAKRDFVVQYAPKNYLNNLNRIFISVNNYLDKSHNTHTPKIRYKKNKYREPSGIRAPRPNDPK